jgi:hypothetical protein
MEPSNFHAAGESNAGFEAEIVRLKLLDLEKFRIRLNYEGSSRPQR